MKTFVRLCVIAGALVLTACATPELTSANEAGGVIARANGTNEDAAFKIADAYCRQHGRVAQITGTDEIYNRVHFACVGP